VSFEHDAEPQEVGDDKNRRIDMLYHCTVIGTAVAPAGPPAAANPLGIVPLT
jgi:hypothetical protein